MLKKFLLLILLSCCCANPAISRNLGMGIILGAPTGISVKTWTTATNAAVLGIAWNLEEEDISVHFHIDYIWHNFRALNVDVEQPEGRLGFYYGIGSRLSVETDEDSRLGPRLPIGLNYVLLKVPIDFFLEIAPILDIVPDIDFALNGGIGARFFFF